MAKKYALTPEHRARFPEWRDKWVANAMSTEAMTEADRDLCREAVRGLYAAAKLDPPKHIVFVPSPFVLAFAGGYAAGIWHLSKGGNPATWDAARAATWDATRAATRAAGLSQWYAMGGNPAGIAASLGSAAYLLGCAQRVWHLWQGGNQWPGYDSFISFFRHVAQLRIDYTGWQHWETLALHSGPRIVHADFCMISDRPSVLKVDNENRLHCEDGPSCQWRDGSALFAIHGVRIPAWVVLHPERITVEAIDAENNTEVRRVMMERYGLGRYVADSGAIVVDALPDDHPQIGLRGARLLRKPSDSYERDLYFVECVNSSAEPDGSYRRYHLAINPKHYRGRAGKSVIAAMASTWRDPLDRTNLLFPTPADYVFAGGES